MKTSDYKTLEAILKHKTYFDSRLIEIVEELRDKDKVYADNVKLYKLRIKQLNLKNENLNNKLNLVKNEALNLKNSNKEKDEKIDDLIKIIDSLKNELNEIKKDNKDKDELIKTIILEKDEITKINNVLNKKIKKLSSANSSNSNMPSSFDILSHSKVKVTSSRNKSNLNKGGQLNHVLHKSKLSLNPDEVIIKKVKKAPLAAIEKIDDDGNTYYVTQEVDLILKSKIIETRYYLDIVNGEELPLDIKSKYSINPLTYSDHFKSTMLYLNTRGCIPYKRLSEMIYEISDKSINVKESTIVSWLNEFKNKAANTKEDYLKDIKSKDVVHTDETGIKINGDLYWVHTINNNNKVFYTVSKSRSNNISLLLDYSGTLVHDHFKPYYKLSNCKHSECNAHIDRYLKSGIEFDNSKECEEVLDVLHNALALKNELIASNIKYIDYKVINEYKEKLINIMSKAITEYETNNKDVKAKYVPDYIKLFRRMIEYIDEHLMFLYDFNIPYTNNLAERSLRVIKTKKKVSGQFVSSNLAQSYLDVMSIVQTSKLNNTNSLKSIEEIFNKEE